MIKTRIKNDSGVSLVELSAALIIAVPIFLLAFDCLMFVTGIQVNDRACRDAVRLAASGDPTTAELRAQNVISRANEEKHGNTAEIRLVSVANSINIDDLKAARLNGGTVTGTVTVTTAADLRPFFASFLSKNQLLTFEAKQSFPYTHIFKAPVEPKNVMPDYSRDVNKKDG